jgi:phosphate starvation-inducible PhoH-like protein
MPRGRSNKNRSQSTPQDLAMPRSCSFKGAISPAIAPGTSIETKSFIKPCTLNQRLFVKAIKNSDVIIGVGPSGCGKTLLAIHTAITLINSEDSPIDRLIYIRPNVDRADEVGLGYLPGSEIEKTKPLAYPVLDNLMMFMSKASAEYLIDSGKVEVLTMSMLRGRSFPNCVLCLDESQNSTPGGMKTLLTRIGENSKAIILGDTSQRDRPDRDTDGLSDLVRRVQPVLKMPLDDNYYIDMVKFTREDVVRNGVIKTILRIYEGEEDDQ